MLHEFALAPGLFDPRTVQSSEGVQRNLKHVLGISCESGLIADLSHDDWVSQVTRNVGNMPSRALRRSLMKEAAFPDNQRIVPMDEAIGSTWMEVPSSVDLKKNVAGMTRFLEPLLRHASRISLADPCMSCRSNTSLTTLRIVVSLLRNRKHPEDLDARIRGWRDAIGSLGSRPLAVRVSFWGDDDEIFHDRYAFTDQCAVSVPAGPGCYSSRRANTTRCARLMYYQLADVHRSFQRNTSPYTLLGSAVI